MIEIERKFLVANNLWRTAASSGTRYRQGYLAKSDASTIRIRCSGVAATLTIKSARRGLTRDEFSYPIPLAEAEEMLALCGDRIVEKVRYSVEHVGDRWDVDVYRGAAEGLVIAELELEREEQLFAIPPWLGAEVSFDPRYRNSALALLRAPQQAPPRKRPTSRPDPATTDAAASLQL